MDPEELAAAVHEHADGATVGLRVVPRARRTGPAGMHAAAVKLKVAAPPVDGAANREVRRWLAGVCGLRPGDVELVAGERGRDKVALVRDLDAAALRRALAAAP